jgi:protein translocase SEC61 complex gamma subunit
MNFNIAAKLRNFYSDAQHVMSVSYRPDMDTFKRTLKIVLIGIILLGILGFVLYLLINNVILGQP